MKYVMEVISYYARNHTGSISSDYKVAFRSQKDKINCLLNVEKEMYEHKMLISH